MSTGDWIAIGVMPLGLAVGWIQSFRVWRRQADVSAGVTWFTGEPSSVGLHAFLLPGTLGLTLICLGLVADLLDGGLSPAAVGQVSSWTIGVGFLLLLLGFWMWLFAWPRVLVPPHLRGRPGWVMASWRTWREGRAESRQQRREPRSPGGDHARR